MKRKRLLAIFASSLVLSAGMLSSAEAITSPDQGSQVTKSGTGVTQVLHVRRMRESIILERGAYGNWNKESNRIDNNGAEGSVVSREVGQITAYRACTDNRLAPDSCSDWVNQGRVIPQP